jgi:NAD-dependent dihydropyrimidine dehydrogenase PreA subunit
VDQGPCDGCQTCIDRCQYNAIEMVKVPGSKRLKAFVDPELCFGCGVCVLKCDTGAMTMSMVRPPEHIPAAA